MDLTLKKHFAKESHIKGHMLYDSIYMTFRISKSTETVD